MYHQDWLMRQIEAISAFLAFLLTQRRPSSHAEEATVREVSPSGECFDRISALLRAGRICEAENELFRRADGEDEEALRTGVWFYGEVNKLSDGELAARDFSREEIADGLRDLCARYDIQSDLFL